jgi:hypothetical protein
MPIEKNRILVPKVHIFEMANEPDKPAKIAVSRKHLPFLIDEFISQGVSELILWDKRDVDLDTLPKILRTHISEAKSAGRTVGEIFQIFKPVFEELGIQSERGLGFSVKYDKIKSEEQRGVVDAAADACMQLQSFLVAFHDKSLCQFDITSILTKLELLYKSCRSTEARTNVSVLRGVFSGYKPISHAAIVCSANSSEAMLELFEELLDDAHYKSLSHEASGFGALANINKIKRNIAKLVKAIVHSRKSKGMLDYGSRALTVATGLPVPTSELADFFIRNSYFPPVLDLSDGIARATSKMIETYPDTRFVSVDLFSH